MTEGLEAAAQPEAPSGEPDEQSGDHDEPDCADPDCADPVAPAPPSPAALRRDAVATIVIMVVVIGFIMVSRAWWALSDSPTEDQCARLVDRHLKQAARQRFPRADDRALAQALARARVSPARASDVARCRKQLSEAQVACGLRASNVDALERCIQ